VVSCPARDTLAFDEGVGDAGTDVIAPASLHIPPYPRQDNYFDQHYQPTLSIAFTHYAMETITNAATSVTTTVSNLIYGQPTKENEAAHNETGGSEPLSGAQGKGTVDEPFDQGNAGKRSYRRVT
jgi:hypothetical protein